MEEKDVIKQGEAFERLFNNADFKVLQKFIQGEIQFTSSTLLGPDGPNTAVRDFEDFKKQKGLLLGLATPQSYMENIVEQMKKFKEERRLEKLKEEKRARTK